ncbi:hypothetical protein, partial [Myroides odoratimimus]|uniref:hypothetical protein n=1 Tax=Myroides odoratimimus TaxID=76832 RepID=UPI003100E003
TVTVKNGEKGADGIDGKSVTVTPNPDGSATITDGAGGTVTVKNGEKGADGKSVTVTPNPDGSATITDGAGGTVTVKNGEKGADGIDGKSVTVTPNPDGSATITDGAGGTVTVKNGIDGKDGIGGKTMAGTAITIEGEGSEDNPYIVNADVSKLILSGDVTGPANANKLTSLKEKPVNQTAPTTEGQALVYNGTEWIAGTPSIDVTNVLNAKDLIADDVEPTIEIVSGGVKAVLVETILRVKDESITSTKIKDGTIQPIDMADGGNNQVLVTDSTGKPKWEDKSKVGEVITADNGLTKTGTNVQLGGTLLKATEIVTTSTSTLALKGLDKKNVQDQQTQHLLAVDNNGDVIKALKAAMPKFFYMPSVIIPTSLEQMNATGSGSLAGDTFDDSSLTGKIDLYGRYVKQFGTPVTSNLGKNTSLPVLPKSELDYFITWVDTTVFDSVAVDDDGVLTYKLKQNADVTVGTFMNIVFSVRNDN